MFDNILSHIRLLIPTGIFNGLNPWYHRVMATTSAVWYRFPARQIKVIAVTGTKGKSSTVEILSAILEEAGHKIASSNTIRFRIGEKSWPNLYKMSMPGRGFMQRFLRQAVNAGCEYAVLEMTSQGAITFRHAHIDLNAFVLTNISPEHIEAHGSYENYVTAKLSLVCDGLRDSSKPNRILITNADDPESARFIACIGNQPVKRIEYSLKQAEPYNATEHSIDFTWNKHAAHSPLSGTFNLYNILAAATAAKSQGISDEKIIATLSKFSDIKGRVEEVEAGQNFKVIVDYAHTADSLEKLYKVFRPDPTAPHTNKLIAVLGGTGGGRDTRKRAVMGGLADKYCDIVILTDEDPYDEDPNKIVTDVAAGITLKKPTIIMDRRLAIREAISRAQKGDVILITGKGTDPYIMGPRGNKTPWSDANIAREEIEKTINDH
ncbi:MAG: UDP-N-acetylmuramyl-tripeptide synthetase [Patescibacteria group bacterium]|nr:UDP-N-acetylmuramyl-tripeptide synthetase [Patescibacteria group bacterium]